MLKNLLLFGALLFCLFKANAQGPGQINGQLYAEGNLPVEGATIQLKELKSRSTTNHDGHFHFDNLKPGNYTIVVTHSGYQTETRKVTLNGSQQQIDIHLKSTSIQLEAITVTAEKRENTLQKVPMAVSALSGKQIKEKNIREVGDLVLSVPNLMSMNVGSPSLSTISIRGIITFSESPAVGVYIDGIPMFDGYSSSWQLQDVSRIEVLRGPQGTLYGRNGLGGIINIITNQPQDKPTGFAEVSLGNYASQRYSAGFSAPLIKNKLLMGFSGLYDTRNGFYNNLYTSKKFDKPQTYGGNFYMKYLASERFTLKLNVKGEYNHVEGAFPYVTDAQNYIKNNPYTVNLDGTNTEKRRLLNTSLQAIYKLKNIELSSVTGHTYLSDRYSNYDVDYSPYNVMVFEVPRPAQNTFTQEFKITTAADKKLRFTGGIFGFTDRKVSQTVYHYGPDGIAYYPAAPFTKDIYSTKRTYGISGYANLSYAFAEQWNITAGLRYDYEKRNLTYSTDSVKAPNPPVVIAAERKIYGNNDAFSPMASLSYTPQKDLLLYATFSRGYRSGGFNQYTSNPARLNYKPEYTNNYEIGIKSEWFDHRLRANAALFYTAWKDQQQTVNVPDMFTDNLGKLTTKGGELELTALPIKGLEINYNLGVVHSNYQQLFLNDPVTGALKNYEGNKQIFTPDFTSSLSLVYRQPVSHETSLFFIPEWKYFGKQYMTYYNDLVQNPFSLLNATAGIKYHRVELSIWGKNIGNEKYFSFAYATQSAATTPVLLSNPRTFGVTLSTKF